MNEIRTQFSSWCSQIPAIKTQDYNFTLNLQILMLLDLHRPVLHFNVKMLQMKCIRSVLVFKTTCLHCGGMKSQGLAAHAYSTCEVNHNMHESFESCDEREEGNVML